MFKSTFAKYLTVFVVILLISFLLLTSIVTTTIRDYVIATKEESLVRTSAAISAHFEKMQIEDIKTFVSSGLGAMGIIPIINQRNDVKIILTDADGNILLTTVRYKEIDGVREPVTFFDEGELGSIDFGDFTAETVDSVEYLCYDGELAVIGEGRYHICSMPIRTSDVLRGYAVSILDVGMEDGIISNARKTIINSSLWIMLSAIIALYLITERVINPLKNMTKATKSFAKGDFSTRVTVVGHDEIAELGTAFNQMAESLDSFEKMRNSFLASVSHDLRTPMTTIAGFIDGITSGAIPPDKHEYYLGIISAEVHRLSRLVSDLLDISRLESGERKFNFESFDIAEVARIILISFEQKIEEKKLDIIFESDDDNMLVYADRDAIHQVLYNLCHNAIKFSKQGGKLAISITRAKDRRIRISVYDEGESIAREELPLVFDRFYKTDKSRGLDKNGIGLGLYICKTIIDAHGEGIHAESPSDNGAEFWFTL
ncbi:MAG: HAMP domain-containing histidine kinase, partial [Clostridia bacterium]|nr:HAMP domain-containing histidine kinase [Clostridia bacterium]